MRKPLVAIVLVIAASTPLRAQEVPWCVEVDAFTKNCAFTSYEECTAVANNATSPATGVGRCVRNPNYQAPPAPAKSARPAPARSSSTAQSRR